MPVFFALLLHAAAILVFIGGLIAGFFLKDWKAAIFGLVSFAILAAIQHAVISKETRDKANDLLSNVGFLIKLVLYLGGGAAVGGIIGYMVLSWFGVLAGAVIGMAIGFGGLISSD